MRRFDVFLAAAAVAIAFAVAPPVPAGAQSGPPNALQGFSQNRNEPIKIEALTLEVRDKDKTATFIDNVRLTQGDTTLETRRLTVFYDGDAATAGKGGAAAGARNQQIRRIEARGGVVVSQRGQTAVGDEAIYDVATNNMTLLGNVVVTQGQNVIRGGRLWVDLATGTSRVESRAGGGRVQGVFLPGSAPGRPGAAMPAAASDARRATGSTSGPADISPRGNRGPGAPAPAQPPRRLN